MRPLADIQADSARLVESVDAVLAEAVRLGGGHIACRPGCFECCRGPVEISPLDALRLRQAMDQLRRSAPARAGSILARAAALTVETDDSLCPALDPSAGTCDLYPWRPLVCRVFGPATRWNDPAVAVCELCFTEAGDDEIAACAIALDTEQREAPLNREAEAMLPTPAPDPATITAWLRRF